MGRMIFKRGMFRCKEKNLEESDEKLNNGSRIKTRSDVKNYLDTLKPIATVLKMEKEKQKEVSAIQRKLSVNSEELFALEYTTIIVVCVSILYRTLFEDRKIWVKKFAKVLKKQCILSVE